MTAVEKEKKKKLKRREKKKRRLLPFSRRVPLSLPSPLVSRSPPEAVVRTPDICLSYCAAKPEPICFIYLRTKTTKRNKNDIAVEREKERTITHARKLLARRSANEENEQARERVRDREREGGREGKENRRREKKENEKSTSSNRRVAASDRRIYRAGSRLGHFPTLIRKTTRREREREREREKESSNKEELGEKLPPKNKQHVEA